MRVTYCILVRSACETSTHYFHAQVGRCRLHKKRTGTRYVKFVFLHQVGSAGNKGHYGAFGERNVDALFLAWVGPERLS
jgi:hypothetical protein